MAEDWKICYESEANGKHMWQTTTRMDANRRDSSYAPWENPYKDSWPIISMKRWLLLLWSRHRWEIIAEGHLPCVKHLLLSSPRVQTLLVIHLTPSHCVGGRSFMLRVKNKLPILPLTIWATWEGPLSSVALSFLLNKRIRQSGDGSWLTWFSQV